MPDCFEDASSWFEGEGDFSLPARLCLAGFDVWFLNPKSVQPSGTSTNTAAFNNDSIEDYSEYLSVVNAYIHAERAADAQNILDPDME